MSSHDGGNGGSQDRGWYDDSQTFKWDSRDHGGTTDWTSLENHGVDGSHWGWELGQNWRDKGHDANVGERFTSLSDANMVARELALDQENWLYRINEDTNASEGVIGRVEVRWSEDDMAWFIWIDAYTEY